MGGMASKLLEQKQRERQKEMKPTVGGGMASALLEGRPVDRAAPANTALMEAAMERQREIEKSRGSGAALGGSVSAQLSGDDTFRAGQRFVQRRDVKTALDAANDRYEAARRLVSDGARFGYSSKEQREQVRDELFAAKAAREQAEDAFVQVGGTPTARQRLAPFLEGTVKGAGAAWTNTLGMVQQQTGGTLRENYLMREQQMLELERARTQYYLEQAEDPLEKAAWGMELEKIDQALKLRAEGLAQTKTAGQDLFDTASRLSGEAAKANETATRGMSAAGKLLTEAAQSTILSAADMAAGALTGTGMAPFVARAFGGGTLEAREMGEDTAAQWRYGAVGALKEYIFEKLFGINNPFMKGGGSLDDAALAAANRLVDSLTVKLGASETGETVMRGIAQYGLGALGEGAEEFLGALTDHWMPMLYGEDPEEWSETGANMLYNTLVGIASGAMGGTLNAGIKAVTGQPVVDMQAGYRQNRPVFDGVQAKEDAGQQKTAPEVGAGDVSLVQRLQQSVPELQGMKPVAEVTGQELPQGEKIVDRLVEFVNRIGNKVNRPGFGDVLFSRGRIKSSMLGHGIGNAKIELFAAVPSVIQNGKQIDFQEKWKGRDYDTYTFAAPVSYRGKPTYLGVIVTKDAQDGRYYVHEAIDENGNIIFTSKENAEATSGHSLLPYLKTDSSYGADASATGSIPQTTQKSKRVVSDEERGVFGPQGQLAVDAAVENSMLNGKNKVEAYAAFAQAYQQGLTGEEMTAVDGLTRDGVETAYRAGREDAEASLAREKRAARFASVAGDDAGLVLDDYVNETMESGEYDVLNETAKRLGVRVRFVDELKHGANADIHGSEILIQKDNPNPVRFLLGHEFAHRLQALAPEAYRQFRDLAMGQLGSEMTLERRESYAEQGVDVDYEGAMDELTADYAGLLMEHGKVLEDFIAEAQRRDNRTLLEKVRDLFRELAAKLTGKQREQAMTAEQALSKALMEAEKQAKKNAKKNAGKNKTAATEGDGVRYSFAGYDAETGRGIYQSNFPKGTPKSAKAKQILHLIQDVWSKKPIDLVIKNADGSTRTIEAQFDPTYSEDENVRTDASKLMGGNRHGTSSDQRVTLDLADDYYQIAEEAEYNYSKSETGKESATHQGVKEWHYFVNDILFQEYGEQKSTPYRVTINVKERSDGSFVYSFSAERQNEGPSTRRTLHADVNQIGETDEANAQPFDDSITDSGAESNSKFSLTGAREFEERILRKENERLRQRVEYWKGQTRKTETALTDPKAVRKTARKFIKEYGSDISVDEIAGELQTLYDYMTGAQKTGAELTYEEVSRRAEHIGQRLVETAVAVNDEVYRERAELRQYLRDTKIFVPRSIWGDLDVYGGYNEFRKANMGRLNLSSAEGTGIDQVYSELSATYPGMFDEAAVVNPADQLIHMAEILDGVYSVQEYNPFSADMEQATRYVAGEIIDTFFDVPEAKKTYADKQNDKMNRLRMENREQIQRILQRERRLRKQQEKRLKDHFREIQEQRSARQTDSAARNRLLKIAQRLQNKKLPEPTRALVEQYIGELDTVAVSITGQKLGELSRLQSWYETKRATDPDFIPDPKIERALARLSQKRISELSTDEVVTLTDILLHIEHETRTEKKLIDDQDKRDTHVLGEEVIQNIHASGGARFGFLDRYIVTETLSPVRQIRRLTGYVDSDPLTRAVNSMADGQRAMLNYRMRAERPFRKFAEDKRFSARFSGKEAERISITGETESGRVTVTITPAMRASLYLHSLNSQNLRHITEGGITVPDEKLYKKGKLEEAYAKGTTIKLRPSEVRRITEGMTMTDRSFATETHRYFNGMSKEEVNKTSERLKGYSLARVSNYFPVNTDTRFTRTEFETLKHDGTIEGMGFLKERVNYAGNPILLRDVNLVLEQSIRMHSKYIGLAIPVRNFNKIWNVTTGHYDEEGNWVGYDHSVQQAMEQAWGTTGSDYIEKMMSDVQEESRKKNQWTKPLNKVKGNYAGAVLTLNASVAMKQAASYPTAAAVLGWKPLARAMADTGKVNLELIERFTPLQWYRSEGFSTKELGDLKTSNRQLPAVLNWVQGVDVLTTRKLWKASEFYIREHNKELQVGTDAYYKAVADIYNRVIEETQPNYTTMQRPQLLRSDDSLLGNLMMFKTQPFQNFNILYDAAGNLIAKKRQAKASGDSQAVEAAKRDFSRAVTSQLVQLAVFAAMTMAWGMFRGKRDKYEDENGDITLLSMLRGLGKDMVGGLFSDVPFGSDVWELADSKLFGGTYYGTDAVTITAIIDTIDSVSGIAELISDTVKSTAAGETVDWNHTRLTLDHYADDLTKAAGIPYENIMNLFNAVCRQVCIKTSGKYLGEYQAMKLTTDPEKYKSDYYDLLWKAMQKGVKEYEAIYADMIEQGYFSEKDIKKAMEKRMKAVQGVQHVDELDRRYLSPSEEERYEREIRELAASELWKSATADQRAKAEENLYGAVTGTDKKIVKTLEDGAQYGLDEAEYVLYRLALDMQDQKNQDSKVGSYTNDEVEAAIRAVDGLTDQERGYLWIAQGKKDKSNPWG